MKKVFFIIALIANVPMAHARAQKRIDMKTQELIQQLKIGGIYKHYKGNLYKVLMLSKSADDLSWWVVYQCLYDNALSTIWHRKLEDFLQIDTWIEGQPAMPRFALVEH